MVFDADGTKERKFAPWEVKEATVKTAFLMGVVYMWDTAIPLGAGYAALQTFLCGKYAWTVYGLMSSAVTKVVLLPGGKQAELTFGRTGGATTTVNNKDIQKQAHQKITLSQNSIRPSPRPKLSGSVSPIIIFPI